MSTSTIDLLREARTALAASPPRHYVQGRGLVADRKFHADLLARIDEVLAAPSPCPVCEAREERVAELEAELSSYREVAAYDEKCFALNQGSHRQ